MENKILAQLENGKDYNAILADLASLRADVAGLANHMAGATRAATANAQSSMTAEATRMMDAATQAGKSTAKTVEAQIDAHPALSLLMAFALGFVGSRLLPR